MEQSVSAFKQGLPKPHSGEGTVDTGFYIMVVGEATY